MVFFSERESGNHFRLHRLDPTQHSPSLGDWVTVASLLGRGSCSEEGVILNWSKDHTDFETKCLICWPKSIGSSRTHQLQASTSVIFFWPLLQPQPRASRMVSECSPPLTSLGDAMAFIGLELSSSYSYCLVVSLPALKKKVLSILAGKSLPGHPLPRKPACLIF